MKVYNAAMTTWLIVCSFGFFLGLVIIGLLMAPFDATELKDAQAALHKKSGSVPS